MLLIYHVALVVLRIVDQVSVSVTIEILAFAQLSGLVALASALLCVRKAHFFDAKL